MHARDNSASSPADERSIILPDVIEPGLRVVFCGTAAGTKSARVGAYYAGPGNAFWTTLHDVGLTPRRLEPSDGAELPKYGIGLTDICKVASGSDRQVGTGGFDAPGLVATLEEHCPEWVAFNGTNAAEAALARVVQHRAVNGVSASPEQSCKRDQKPTD